MHSSKPIAHVCAFMLTLSCFVLEGRAQEGDPADAGGAASPGPVIETWGINGNRLLFTVTTPIAESGEDGPVDSLTVVFERKKGTEWTAAPNVATLYESMRFGELHEFAYDLREPFTGRVRLQYADAQGQPGGELSIPVEFRDAFVHVWEETVGKVRSAVEVVPGFAEPLVLLATDPWGAQATDLDATYRFTFEGNGAGAFRIAPASYREDMLLDVQWWGTLVCAAAAGAESEGESTAAEGVTVEFRDGACRIAVIAMAEGAEATLVGTPTRASSKLSPVRIPIESGLKRAGGDKLTLERMRKYPGHWRFWMSSATAVKNPWRQEGASIRARAFVMAADDEWLEVDPPFSEIHWVQLDDAGKCWSFTGVTRETEGGQPMKMTMELRDEADAVVAQFDVDLD